MEGKKEEQVLHLPGVVEDELVVGGEGGVHVRRGPPRRRVVRPGRAGKMTVAAVARQTVDSLTSYNFAAITITNSFKLLITPRTCLPRLWSSGGSISDGDM